MINPLNTQIVVREETKISERSVGQQGESNLLNSQTTQHEGGLQTISVGGSNIEITHHSQIRPHSVTLHSPQGSQGSQGSLPLAAEENLIPDEQEEFEGTVVASSIIEERIED